jgi:hypothetical protein
MTRHERRTCPACATPGAVPVAGGLPGAVPAFECLDCGRLFGVTDDDRLAAEALLAELVAAGDFGADAFVHGFA